MLCDVANHLPCWLSATPGSELSVSLHFAESKTQTDLRFMNLIRSERNLPYPHWIRAFKGSDLPPSRLDC